MSALEFKLTCGKAADLAEDDPQACHDNANVLNLKRQPGAQMTNGRPARRGGTNLKLRRMTTQ